MSNEDYIKYITEMLRSISDNKKLKRIFDPNYS